MKAKIHPKYVESKVTCSCGETFTTQSTQPQIRVEICSKCHPFYTGKQKFIDAGGRVEKFQKKYAKRIQELKEADEKAKREKESAAEAMADKEKEKAEQAAASEPSVEEQAEESKEEEQTEESKQEEQTEEQPQDETPES